MIMNIVIGVGLVAIWYFIWQLGKTVHAMAKATLEGFTLVGKQLKSFDTAIGDFDTNWRAAKEELENKVNDARNRVFALEGNKANWDVVVELDKRVALLSGKPTVTKFSYDPELAERGLQGEFDFRTVAETKGPGVERE